MVQLFILTCSRNVSAAEAILLGFQHYLVMLGTTVIIPTALVPQMGGGNVSADPSRNIEVLYPVCYWSNAQTCQILVG